MIIITILAKDELYSLVNLQDQILRLYYKLTPLQIFYNIFASILNNFAFLFEIFRTPISLKACQQLFMVQVEGFYKVVFPMWYCMRVETTEKSCELTQPRHLLMPLCGLIFNAFCIYFGKTKYCVCMQFVEALDIRYNLSVH